LLSPSLSQLLERARTGFGLEVEVIDAALRHVYPDATTALGRMIEQSPVVRQSLRDALAGGRPERLDDDSGLEYQLFPLRRTARIRQASALMAVRRNEPGSAVTDDRAPWPELARAIVEADLAAADALTDERQHSRRLLATLRFLKHLVQIDTESHLAEAIVQAAAVWFDVDARIFQRDLSGDFVLHTTLPGARVEEAAKRLSSHSFAGGVDALRVGPIPEWGQSAGESDVVLVPLSADGNPDWVLALIGAFPLDAESLFAPLGRVVGVQLETIRARRRDRTREHFEALVEQGGSVRELLAVRLVRELAAMTQADYASLVLNADGQQRRLVSVGASGEATSNGVDAEGPWQFTPALFSCLLPLGNGTSATLQISRLAGARFAPDAQLVTRVAARILQCWLVGAQPFLHDVTRETALPVGSDFMRRIGEELERAKRFDLRLSLVLVTLPAGVPNVGDATPLLQEVMRRELRASDVLGTMSAEGVAALLTHTDGSGLHDVVVRLRLRLNDAAAGLNLPGIKVGHAALSADCCTVESLLSKAALGSEQVSVSPTAGLVTKESA
jgi:hypothetical protein